MLSSFRSDILHKVLLNTYEFSEFSKPMHDEYIPFLSRRWQHKYAPSADWRQASGTAAKLIFRIVRSPVLASSSGGLQAPGWSLSRKYQICSDVKIRKFLYSLKKTAFFHIFELKYSDGQRRVNYYHPQWLPFFIPYRTCFSECSLTRTNEVFTYVFK